MNVIQKSNAMGAQSMTSLEIAEVTGKQHKNIMQAIRNMEPAWMKVNGLRFQLVDYRDSKGELRPCYSLSKDGTQKERTYLVWTTKGAEMIDKMIFQKRV